MEVPRSVESPTLLFVHSPLVGPSAWRRVADVASADGWNCVVADLTGVAAESGAWAAWFVEAVLAAAVDVDGELVVIGHSGAGVMLPSIGAGLAGRCVATVFVDAVVPPPAGAHVPSPTMIEVVDSKAVDGRLPQWLHWWDDDVVASILPDPRDRELVLADMPCLPRAFYDERVPVPDKWANGPNGYVQLSAAYDADARLAADLDWPVARFDGTHLSIVTRPGPVSTVIVDVIGQLT